MLKFSMKSKFSSTVRATFSHIPERVGIHGVIDLIMIRLSGTDLPIRTFLCRKSPLWNVHVIPQTTIMDLDRNEFTLNEANFVSLAR